MNNIFNAPSFAELVTLLIRPIPDEQLNQFNWQQNLGYIYPETATRLRISKSPSTNFEQIAAKLLAHNIYLLPKDLIHHDSFWVEPARQWGEWKKGRCLDETNLKANTLILGWLYGGTTLIVKTKAGNYRLVRFECRKQRGRNQEFAHIIGAWDCLGSTDPYSYFSQDGARSALWDLLGSESEVKLRRRYLFKHLFNQK